MEKTIITKWIEPSETCLELGGGFGRITSSLQPYFSEVVMLDFSSRNLGEAARHLDKKKTNLLRCELHQIPFRDDAFDTVVMVRVAHHLQDPQVVMKEISRIAKNRAVVIISVPNTRIRKFRNLRQSTLVAAGKQGHKIYAAPLMSYGHSSFEGPQIKSSGLFETSLSKKLAGLKFLYLLDILTSPIWMFKPTLFLRYQVRK